MISPYASENDFSASLNLQNEGNYQPTQPQKSQQVLQTNAYVTDYINAVKENRSLYGNYVDNSLAFDPHKEHKSVYNVIYETDGYNPWGKPGGGAPKMDNTGQLKTKIVGTLRWNLNGETEEDRVKRLSNAPKNKNTLLYKKSSSPNATPRLGQSDIREATTYNFNYRNHYNGLNQSLIKFDKQLHQNNGSQFENMTQIEREAEARILERQPNNPDVYKSGSWINRESAFNTKPNRTTHAELNRISNKLYNDNQPTLDYPNDPFWFGRTGTHKTFISNLNQSSASSSSSLYQDARRRKLLDALENRNLYENSNLGTHGLTPRGGQPPPHIPNYTSNVLSIAQQNNVYDIQSHQ